MVMLIVVVAWPAPARQPGVIVMVVELAPAGQVCRWSVLLPFLAIGRGLGGIRFRRLRPVAVDLPRLKLLRALGTAQHPFLRRFRNPKAGPARWTFRSILSSVAAWPPAE